MGVLREIHFRYNKFADDSNTPHLWRLVTWIQTCASLNHRKNMKAEPSWLNPQKLAANLELLMTELQVSPSSEAKCDTQQNLFHVVYDVHFKADLAQIYS